jgi:membrane fusion protein (multidrug efflux system)
MMEGRPASEIPGTTAPPPTPSQTSQSGGAKRAAWLPHWVKGSLVRLAILIIAGGIVVLFAVRWDTWVGARTRQTTDDAYVRGDITPLSAKIEGYVRRVAVSDFQLVKAGDILVEIDDEDYRARVAQAEADVLGAEAAIQNLKARKALQKAVINQAESTIAATEADVTRTQLELDRQRKLLATTYGTPQKVEQAVADEKRFEADLARNQADLKGQRQQMAVLDTQESQLRADAKAKRAALDLAKITLGYTVIVAPVDGMVGERGVRAGQYVHAGTQIISVIPLDNVWVIANYKETQLTRVAIGQKAKISVDTFPGIVVTGRVDSIAPASGSQFSLLPPDNATGNFTKVVQRIPVKVLLDPTNPLAGRLRPGMSVIATIDTDSAAVKP